MNIFEREKNDKKENELIAKKILNIFLRQYDINGKLDENIDSLNKIFLLLAGGNKSLIQPLLEYYNYNITPELFFVVRNLIKGANIEQLTFMPSIKSIEKKDKLYVLNTLRGTATFFKATDFLNIENFESNNNCHQITYEFIKTYKDYKDFKAVTLEMRNSFFGSHFHSYVEINSNDFISLGLGQEFILDLTYNIIISKEGFNKLFEPIELQKYSYEEICNECLTLNDDFEDKTLLLRILNKNKNNKMKK